MITNAASDLNEKKVFQIKSRTSLNIQLETVFKSSLVFSILKSSQDNTQKLNKDSFKNYQTKCEINTCIFLYLV